jgi:acetate kinase
VRVLVVNAGSSSLKLRLLEDAAPDAAPSWARDLDAPGGRAEPEEVRAALGEVEGVDAVGHRVVHGGPHHTRAVLVDDAVQAQLADLRDLAPLHMPPALAALEAVRAATPGTPQVACFDTAFHATLPPAAATYPVPRAWRERFPLRRYGFHGLSHAYAARRAGELAGRPLAELRTVTCHLGAGSSLAAVAGGRCVDTTMGFTPLEGLVMATRSGTVDPGLVLWLARPERLGLDEVADGLEHRSGLTGLAGTPDMREVLARADAGDGEAALALDVLVHRLRALVAAMAAALGGLDALVFTGGIGERSAAVRARAAEGLGFLGVALDRARNKAAAGDADVGAEGAPARAFVVAAREDLEIARQVRELLGEAGATSKTQPA